MARNRHFVPIAEVPQMLQPVHTACQTMHARLNANPEARYMISLARYYLNDDMYLANAFTIFANDSPNLILTSDGVECDAFFERERLRPSTYKNSLSIEHSLPDGRRVHLEKVRVRIRYADMWGIHTQEKGQTISLFLDQAAMIRSMSSRHSATARTP